MLKAPAAEGLRGFGVAVERPDTGGCVYASEEEPVVGEGGR